MIPGETSAPTPQSEGSITFHVVVDDSNHVFCMEGPNSNGVRLHYEMQKRARAGNARLRDFDFRTHSQDDAVAQIQSYYPNYKFLGECLKVWARPA